MQGRKRPLRGPLNFLRNLSFRGGRYEHDFNVQFVTEPVSEVSKVLSRPSFRRPI